MLSQIPQQLTLEMLTQMKTKSYLSVHGAKSMETTIKVIFLIIAENLKRMWKKGIRTNLKNENIDNVTFASTFDEFSPEIIASSTHNKAFSVPTSVTSDCILDSGCSAHMTSRKDLLHSLGTHQGVVTMANGQEIVVKGVGSIWLNCINGRGNCEPVFIRTVLFVPDLKGGNLISESKLELDGHRIVSQNGRRQVFLRKKEVIYAELDNSGQFLIKQSKMKVNLASYHEAHACFGHPGENVMSTLKAKYPDVIPDKPNNFYCPACTLAKSTHKSESSNDIKSKKPLQTIHSDLSGKFSVESLGSKSYYITFIDDYTRFAWISFLRYKSDAYQEIRDFVTLINN